MNPISDKTLILFRHAKAVSGTGERLDAERALTARGKEDAQRAGERLRQLKLLPDLVLCSTSRRTRETLEGLEKSLGSPFRVEYTARLYLTPPAEVLSQIQQTPEFHRSLVVIGHNPALHELSRALAGKGDEEALEALALKFPPAALAVLRFSARPWARIALGEGELEALMLPERPTM